MQPGMLLVPKTHTHITHLTCRHDDLVIQRLRTICRCKPQCLLLHGYQPPVVLLVACKPIAKGDIIEAHYGYSTYCFIHLEANFVC